MSINPAAPHHAHWPARLPRELVVPETTLWFNLEVAAARYPHKAAYRISGRDISFTELKDQAERVLLFMQNCPQFVIAFYAIVRADAAVVPVNPMNRADEFQHCINAAQARFAITTAEVFIEIDGKRVFVPVTSGASTARATSSSPCVMPTVARPSRPWWWCCAPRHAPRQGARQCRLGTRAHGRLQGAQGGGVRRCAARSQLRRVASRHQAARGLSSPPAAPALPEPACRAQAPPHWGRGSR